ncbi:oxidoreductase [Streptomyces sp. CNQ-509]|uniref:aldo/keto reductase n=1 Tax=Streptomyces sp. CNQ-509 TaxID=444103 RepID=UPI00062DD9E0|nr:aldo/keto reductase [Streptomyces sp. CNQ-509]AKH82224.1 oxidoreductase [Streptomyces sp. CNQ-509]
MTAETAAGTFRIGGDLEVGRLGFGAMQLPAGPADARAASVAVARRAVELGVTLIDTAHLYGGGANEELLAEALYPYPEELLITTKVGVARSAETGEWGLDGRPEVLREQVDHALRRLRVERIELLQLHRIDPEVDLAEQVGALRELQEAGKVARLGLSEVTAGELARARELVDVASVQNRYSVGDREHEAVLDACAAAGIAFLPWRPVLGAVPPADAAGAPDAGGPQAPYRVIGAVARELGATPVQVALAWLLAHSPVVLPIPGTAKLGHLEENVAAAGVRLEPAHLERLDALSS